MVNDYSQPPPGLGPRGIAFWYEVTARWELDTHEIALLLEIARTMTDLDALAEAIAEGGVLSETGLKPNPALVEARNQRIALARLIAALRLPEDDGSERPQRRAGVRGTYAGAI